MQSRVHHGGVLIAAAVHPHVRQTMPVTEGQFQLLVILGYISLAVFGINLGVRISDSFPDSFLRRLGYSASIAYFFAPGLIPLNHGAVPGPASFLVTGIIVSAFIGRLGQVPPWILSMAVTPMVVTFVIAFAISAKIPRLNLTERRPFSRRTVVAYLPAPLPAKLLIGGLQVVLVAVFVCASSGIHWTTAPDPVVFQMFPEAGSPAKPEIATALEKLRKTPEGPPYGALSNAASAVGAFGRDAVPYIALLAHENRMNLSPFGFFVTRPFSGKAYAALKSVRDRESIPLLKKLLDDGQLVSGAREVLNDLAAPYSKDELMHALESDIAHYQVRERFQSFYEPALAKLPAEDRVDILVRCLQPKVLGYEDNFGRLSELSDQDLDFKTRVLKQLAETHSDAALRFLKAQTADLKVVVARADATVNDPQQMRGFTDAGRERSTKQAKASHLLLGEYERSIAAISK